MLKKILLIIITAIFCSNTLVSANCSYNKSNEDSWDTATNLMGCLEWWKSKLVEPEIDALAESWFKKQIVGWVKNIAWFLWLIAVSALVYAGFMMAISTWEEDKIKKAKDIVKWTLLWFLWVVTAGSIISIIVNFMYSF